MAPTVEDSVIKTSSIEQFVAPIAAHLCYLVLLSESEGEPEQFTQLEAAAHTVVKASKNMTAVVSRVMAESDDDVMRMEMSPLLETLMVSGQHVLLATQKLNIQPDIAEHKDELIEATQNVLLGVVKILIVEDDATVRKITAAAQWVLDCLSQVGAAIDISSLLKAFQLYSKAMLLFHNLVAMRILDLRDHRQREQVKASMETLRRCISMLHTAMYTTIKHPTSEDAQSAKKYILHQVDSTINDIIITLKSSCECVSTSSYGYYTDRRNRLLRLLSDPGSLLLKDSDFDIVLRDLVFHSMAVANSSRRQIRSYVAANCKLVLQLWSDMLQQMKFYGPKQSKECEANLCVTLMKQIHKLDESVVTATLYQVMDIFDITSSPLEQLVNTVHCILEGESDTDLDHDQLQRQAKAFIAHADRMSEVASFISALANDERSLESVENSRACLMYLKDGVTPLLLELGGDSVQSQGALHKLINVHQKWTEETDQLLNVFTSIINVKDLMHLEVQEIKSDLESCVEAHKMQDHQLLCKHFNFLTVRMSHVIQFARRHVDKSVDPIYRNGLLVLVRQAESSAAEVAGYVTDILSINFNEDAFSLLANSVSVAIRNFHALLQGLDGLQHPYLLSPLREGARQPAVTPPLPIITDPQRSENDQANSECVDLPVGLKDELPEKDDPKTVVLDQFDRDIQEGKSTFTVDCKLQQTPENIDLLPLLCEVICMTKGKDVEALNLACTGVVELSNCYTQATKEAASFVKAADIQEMESLRSEIVTLTPLLVQTAQETAMSSAKSTDAIYRHSTQFSDLIKNTRKILLPVTGMWYHAIQAMIQSHKPNMADACIQELTDVMHLCTDTVQLMTSTDYKVIGESNESMSSLLNKLQKAQTNTKNLTDLLGSKPTQPSDLDGNCVLWALSIQVLLSSLDRFLGTVTTHVRGYQMTPQKWLLVISEHSLRIQEAARLSSVNCRDSYKVKLLKEQQDEVKTLTEVYLQATENLGTVSRSGVLIHARTEFLQRQLQVKMKALSCLLSRVNEGYVSAIQNTVSLAYSVIKKDSSMEAEGTRTQFEASVAFLLGNVKTATESVQDCLNFIRDPRERSNLRFINDHLLFQMSEIVSRARFMVETQSVSETLSLDIQAQCWSAKAHYLVDELIKIDGILYITKEQIKLGLQGKDSCGALEMNITQNSIPKDSTAPSQVITEKNPVNIPKANTQEPKLDLLTRTSSVDPSYTSLFLKQEAGRWDVQGNQIVKLTQQMADKIYHMTQYLKRKGPIQSKDAFVTSAKDLVLSCQFITQFVKVVAEHCLDKHCTKELCIIAEQIVTITNQLTIISSVNAVTPGCTSSDEILVKNAQNLLQTVINGVRAAETACIKGLRQPEPNSEAAKAASLCFQWKHNLLIHRAQENMNPDTDDLGLRKTALQLAAPSLAPHINMLKIYK